MTMRSGLAGFAGLLAAALALALAGCVVSPYPTATAVASDQQPTDETAEQAGEAPPPLPAYDQPPAPEDGYIWVPGVWRWGPEGYFWVPGTWVMPPSVGLLWTPGYWGFAGAVYVFHPGYWGPHVGYYGGINYGHGYFGNGYEGGRWVNNRFQYNTAVTNVNVTNIHNTYNERVVNNVTNNVSRVSYVGAPGARGASARAPAGSPPPVARELRVPPTQPQQQHHDMARTMPYQNAAHNVGRPPVAATPRPTAYTAHGVTSARIEGPAYHPQQRAPAPAPEKGPH
jgi:hypothetical protein